jgi:glycosyltransferase involved in cell wall biosynthesis
MAVKPSIAIDVRMLRHAGIGTYIRHVVPRVVEAHPDWQFTLLGPRERVGDWGVEAASNATVVPCKSGIYSLSEQIEIPLRTPRVDLFWSPHYNIPVFSRIPLVVTVHDVGHLALPGTYGGSGGLKLQYARRMFDAVRRRAREVMFDSDFTRGEFTRYVGEPRRATTIHLGVDAEWSEPVTGPAPHPRPYLLFVGSAKPHKNLGTLLRAFELLRGTIPHDLVIVGGQDQRTVDTEALGVAARLGDRVRTVGDADDDLLKRFVVKADALVLPSLYEGFGLPPLEAMAAGCPTIVSTAASLIEVCGDAPLYFDPRDSEDLARQIVRLLSDATLRARHIKAGRARAAQFDWDVCAARTASVLERAL